MDAELAAEREKAAAARRAKEEAIEAKKAELQALQDTRKQEVRLVSEDALLRLVFCVV